MGLSPVQSLEQNYNYGYGQSNGLGRLGGLTTTTPRITGGEAPWQIYTPTVGTVAGDDGNTQISTGTQAVGFGTTLADGGGSTYTNGLGHSLHTKWMVA